MNKFKAILLALLVAVLVIFVMQNWNYPNPPIHFLGFEFLPFPVPVIILGFFVVGFLAGWLMSVFMARHHKQEVSSEKPQES